MSDKKLNLAVLISGGGRTLQNILAKIDDGTLNARVNTVISSNKNSYGLKLAEKENIPAVYIPHGKYAPGAAEAVYDNIQKFKTDLILLAGFMHVFTVRPGWENRVMNIHPSLIPSFCGKGYYGEKVHKAVLEYGAKVSGCTVHFVDSEYDRGPIILQSAVAVKENDTPETLAARVFKAECKLYPEAIKLFAGKRLTINGRRVMVDKRNEG